MKQINKKYLSLSIIVITALNLGVVQVNAENGADDQIQNTTTTINVAPTREPYKENREELKIKRDNIKNNIEQKKIEIKTNREETKNRMEDLREKLKSQKDKALVKIAEQRLLGREQALERFEKILETMSNNKNKIALQIPKVKELGLDTTKVEADLTLVDAKIIEAKNKVGEMSTILTTSTNQITKEQKDKLRTLAKDTQTLIKDAHNLIRESAKDLKELVKTKRQSDDSSDDDSQ